MLSCEFADSFNRSLFIFVFFFWWKIDLIFAICRKVAGKLVAKNLWSMLLIPDSTWPAIWENKDGAWPYGVRFQVLDVIRSAFNGLIG